MCELLGASLREKADVSGYLAAFFAHGVKHPHGWGIFREHEGNYEITKEAVNSAKSDLAREVIRTTEPQKHFMAHIRLATAGAVKDENCHPFTGKDASGRTWTLIHNGTIYAVNQTFPYRASQRGNTDSERVFLYLLDKLNEAAPKDAQERFQVLNAAVQTLSERNKLNLIISDGEVLYVHMNMADTLHYLHTENGYILSTRPLNDEAWTPFPLTQLMAFQGGELLFTGTKHGNVFTSVMQRVSVYEAMHI